MESPEFSLRLSPNISLLPENSPIDEHLDQRSEENSFKRSSQKRKRNVEDTGRDESERTPKRRKMLKEDESVKKFSLLLSPKTSRPKKHTKRNKKSKISRSITNGTADDLQGSKQKTQVEREEKVNYSEKRRRKSTGNFRPVREESKETSQEKKRHTIDFVENYKDKWNKTKYKTKEKKNKSASAVEEIDAEFELDVKKEISSEGKVKTIELKKKTMNPQSCQNVARKKGEKSTIKKLDEQQLVVRFLWRYIQRTLNKPKTSESENTAEEEGNEAPKMKKQVEELSKEQKLIVKKQRKLEKPSRKDIALKRAKNKNEESHPRKARKLKKADTNTIGQKGKTSKLGSTDNNSDNSFTLNSIKKKKRQERSLQARTSGENDETVKKQDSTESPPKKPKKKKKAGKNCENGRGSMRDEESNPEEVGGADEEGSSNNKRRNENYE